MSLDVKSVVKEKTADNTIPQGLDPNLNTDMTFEHL